MKKTQREELLLLALYYQEILQLEKEYPRRRKRFRQTLDCIRRAQLALTQGRHSRWYANPKFLWFLSYRMEKIIRGGD